MFNSPGFAAILFAALVLAGLLSWLQSRAYSRATRRLAERFADNSRAVVVSGRGKGRLRGAIVILVVDSGSKLVIGAEVMEGASVLARFHPRADLEGPLSSLPQRTADAKLQQAIAQAQQQYRSVAARRRR